MPAIRTNRGFSKLPNAQLLEFLSGTIVGLTGNAQLPTPPVTTAALTTLKDSFDAAIIDAAQGGTMATAAKNAQREVVINALNKNASYVDITVGGNLEAILSSGYETVSTNRAQSPLEPPQIVAVERPQTGQLRVRIKGDPTMKSVVGRIKQVGGSEFGPSITFQNSKKILFKGLTGGMNYIIQLCGIGGSNGQSDWTESGPNMAL